MTAFEAALAAASADFLAGATGLALAVGVTVALTATLRTGVVIAFEMAGGGAGSATITIPDFTCCMLAAAVFTSKDALG